MSDVDINKTFGALLIGAIVALFLSGIVTAQSFIYIKLYRADFSWIKAVVLSTWTLDMLHTGFICASIWSYFIGHYGEAKEIEFIPWTLPLTIVFTAILTFCVHCFFGHRIFKLSHENLYLTSVILILALLRLVSACVTSTKMIQLQYFALFVARFRWLFTLGLGLSSTVDVIITASLCYYLGSSRTGSSSLDYIIDSLMLYSFENGSLTCAATIISMICWLTMSNNLIFMGIHFAIGKLYANSLLVTLNTRQSIRRGRLSFSTSPHGELTEDFGNVGRGPSNQISITSTDLPARNLTKEMRLQVHVTRSVECTTQERSEIYSATDDSSKKVDPRGRRD